MVFARWDGSINVFLWSWATDTLIEIDDTGDSQEKNFRKPCSLIQHAISKFRHPIILKLVFGVW